jgi:hypothetical protein
VDRDYDVDDEIEKMEALWLLQELAAGDDDHQDYEHDGPEG